MNEEYGIPVIFDVTAHSRQEAGAGLVAMLAGHNIPGTRIRTERNDGPVIESWWTLEGVDKGFDRNDNEPGIVIFRDDIDYLLRLLNETWAQMPGLDVERHDRLKRYFDPKQRVGTADIEEDEACGD